MDKWIKVGSIGVDAGLCWIGDPCYVLHKTHTELNKSGLGKNWEGFCDKLGDDNTHDFGVTGVVVSTGYGDGEYDVFVKYKDGRVAEAKIVFIGEGEGTY